LEGSKVTEYDYFHLRDEYLGKLDVPPAIIWLDVRELPPTPFKEVLIGGPTNKHAIAYFDPAATGWVSPTGLIPFEAFPHWMRLPAPPLPD
jgi:hypothetical protein